MKEVTVKLYHFDELSEDAKHKVCERDREETYGWAYICQESDADERRATLNKFCEVFGIKYDIDYDHQHRFITWHFEDSELEANSENFAESISGDSSTSITTTFAAASITANLFITRKILSIPQA